MREILQESGDNLSDFVTESDLELTSSDEEDSDSSGAVIYNVGPNIFGMIDLSPRPRDFLSLGAWTY